MRTAPLVPQPGFPLEKTNSAVVQEPKSVPNPANVSPKEWDDIMKQSNDQVTSTPETIADIKFIKTQSNENFQAKQTAESSGEVEKRHPNPTDVSTEEWAKIMTKQSDTSKLLCDKSDILMNSIAIRHPMSPTSTTTTHINSDNSTTTTTTTTTVTVKQPNEHSIQPKSESVFGPDVLDVNGQSIDVDGFKDRVYLLTNTSDNTRILLPFATVQFIAFLKNIYMDFEIEEEFEFTSRIIRKSYEKDIYGSRITSSSSKFVNNLKSLFGTTKFTFKHDGEFTQTSDEFFNHIEELLGMSKLLKNCNLITPVTPALEDWGESEISFKTDIAAPLKKARDKLYKKYLDDSIAIAALTKTQADRMMSSVEQSSTFSTPSIPSNGSPWNQSSTRIGSHQLRSDPPMSTPLGPWGGGVGDDFSPTMIQAGMGVNIFNQTNCCSGGDFTVTRDKLTGCVIIYSTCMGQGLVVTGDDIAHVDQLISNISDFKLVKRYDSLATTQIDEIISYFNKRDFESYEIIQTKLHGFETLFDIGKVEVEVKRAFKHGFTDDTTFGADTLLQGDGFGYNKQINGFSGGIDDINDYHSNYGSELMPIVPEGSYDDLNASASNIPRSKADTAKKHINDIEFAINLLYEINPSGTTEMTDPIKSNIIISALCACPWVDNQLDRLKLTNLTSTVLLKMGLNKKRKSDGIYYYNIIKRRQKDDYSTESAYKQAEVERRSNERKYRLC
jgi:hypothetical protein